jgi:hypothetical protein
MLTLRASVGMSHPSVGPPPRHTVLRCASGRFDAPVACGFNVSVRAESPRWENDGPQHGDTMRGFEPVAAEVRAAATGS